ncbi:protein translocase SEC61 complex subunit gamma [Candidatus Pacearchaeota archaeon RBG_19FT_COMBO_34_9]|nr:MAG: protein translocase SEC61 complex subunit gamma [Candidatus Pacearchaeota archaeon RBG_19FT_COMBO_34_9]OGJ16153.1 MAG: protein translocase SEC61 complex subunit gamma [Candidatus Pacearchaeota archaeon RBG_13_33_26]
MKNILSSIKSFVAKCKRVWMVLKKPSRDEFLKVAKVSAIGILIIGLIGFAISIIMKIFTG